MVLKLTLISIMDPFQSTRTVGNLFTCHLDSPQVLSEQ